MARVLDTASVRVEVDVRRGERDAERAGESYGRAYAKGADRQAQRNPITPRVAPIDAAFEAKLRQQIRQIASRVAVDVPLTAKGEQFRQTVAARIAEIERTMKLKVPTDPKLAADFRRKLQNSLDDEMRRVRTRIKVGVDVDKNRITRSLSSLVEMFGSAGEKVSGVASTAFAPVSKVFDSMNLSISGVITTILLAATAAPALAAGLTLVGGAAISAFGAITAGVVGLPVVLTSLIAPIAAISLGMDGIKRAMAPLKDEFKSLKDSVNLAFENSMRPVFEKLQALFPTINVGLAEVARGISRVAMDFAGVATSATGIENVRVALAGVSNVIDLARPGLKILFQSLLDVAGTRELYVILGDTIGGVAQRFGEMIQRVRSSGDLTAALSSLQGVLLSVTDLVLKLAEGSVKFFAKAGPGLSAFFDSLTKTLSRVDWERLGAAFGGMMERLGAAIERVPPETWQRLADAIGNLAMKFIDWAESGGLDRVINTVATAGKALSVLSSIISGASGIIFSVIDNVTGAAGAIGGVADKIGGAFSGVGGSIEGGLGDVPQILDENIRGINDQVDIGLGGIPDKIGGFFSAAKDRIGESFQAITDSTGPQLEGLGQRIDTFFSNLPDRIGYWLGFAAGTAFVKSQEAVEGIAGWFQQLPGRLEAILSDLGSRVGAFFSALPGQLGSLAIQAVGAIGAAFAQLPGLVSGFVSSMVTRVLGFFTSLPSQLGSLAIQAISAVGSAFAELPGKIGALVSKMVRDVVGFFKELPGKLLQAGKDAIQGFIDGVKAKAQSVVDAAKNVVSGAIRGAKDALRQGSPSKEFRDIGKDTVQGYIVGLREKLAPMIAQVRAIFAQAVEVASATMQNSSVDFGALLGGSAPGTAVTNVIQQVLGSMSSGINAADLATAFGDMQLTARFDGPNVITLVNDGNRKLARR